MLEEVAFTWKLIKQFHLRATATGHIPNAETRILLTNNAKGVGYFLAQGWNINAEGVG